MSFMNLAAAISCPEYPYFFLVESEGMEEAKAKDCFFNGTVGCVKLAQQAVRELVTTAGSNKIAASTEGTTNHGIDSISEQEEDRAQLNDKTDSTVIEGNDSPLESLEPTQQDKHDQTVRPT